MEPAGKEIKYRFVPVGRCNMCLSDTAGHRLLGKRLNGHQGMRPKKKGGVTVSFYRCTSCGLIYSDPMPIPENIQDHYGIPPETYWKNQSFEMPEGFLKKDLDILEKLMGSLQDKKALDVGPGLGMGMIVMEQRGMDVYGIEASVPFYERAIEKMNISREKLTCVTIEDAGLSRQTFHLVYAENRQRHAALRLS